MVVETIKALQQGGIRSNLALLQAGITYAERQKLAKKLFLPIDQVTEVVKRADLSR